MHFLGPPATARLLQEASYWRRRLAYQRNDVQTYISCSSNMRSYSTDRVRCPSSAALYRVQTNLRPSQDELAVAKVRQGFPTNLKAESEEACISQAYSPSRSGMISLGVVWGKYSLLRRSRTSYLILAVFRWVNDLSVPGMKRCISTPALFVRSRSMVKNLGRSSRRLFDPSANRSRAHCRACATPSTYGLINSAAQATFILSSEAQDIARRGFERLAMARPPLPDIPCVHSMLHREKRQIEDTIRQLRSCGQLLTVPWCSSRTAFFTAHDFVSVPLSQSLQGRSIMEHIVPMTHPAPELDAVIEQQMRNPSISSVEKPQVMERVWGFAARTDPTVTYEEYVYWAKIEREMEFEENKTFQAEHGSPLGDSIKNSLTKAGRKKAKADKEARLQTLAHLDEKQPGGVVTEKYHGQPVENALKVTDAEWRTAARALRTASWGQMFFLITTDILGWSGAPSVFETDHQRL